MTDRSSACALTKVGLWGHSLHAKSEYYTLCRVAGHSREGRKIMALCGTTARNIRNMELALTVHRHLHQRSHLLLAADPLCLSVIYTLDLV